MQVGEEWVLKEACEKRGLVVWNDRRVLAESRER